MKMNGGGHFENIGPGQVTDDSEMATCLMNALIQSNLNSFICAPRESFALWHLDSDDPRRCKFLGR